MTLTEPEALERRINRMVERHRREPVLDFQLTLLPAAPHGGLAWDHYLEPASLDIALLFELLHRESGRMLCRHVPSIRMRKAPRPLADGSREAEVDRIYVVASTSPSEPGHLRFVFASGEQLRVNAVGAVVSGQANGEEVFASALLQRYRS